VDEVTFDELGAFPALAVDDNGYATLVFSKDKNRIIVLTLKHGRLHKGADVEINYPR
jgi:hypothetical protein